MNSYLLSLAVLWTCLTGLGLVIRDNLPFDSARVETFRSGPETAPASASVAFQSAATLHPIPLSGAEIAQLIGEVRPAAVVEITALNPTPLLYPLTRTGFGDDVPPNIKTASFDTVEACFVGSGELDAEYSRVVAEAEADECGFVPQPEMVQWQIAFSKSFSVRCDFAATLAAYERKVDEIAQEHLGTTVARIDHMGAYSCRNRYGDPDARLSEHARGNAIDISGFVLANGAVVTVLDDWNAGTPNGRFLQAAHDEACRIFHTVLSPNYNDAHANHLHLDLGPYTMCR